MPKYFRGKIMAYHFVDEPYNYEAVDIFLLDGGKLIETYVERNQERFYTLEECINSAAFQDATIVTNDMRHLRTKLVALTILLEKRPRFVGLDSKYMSNPIDAREHTKMLYEVVMYEHRERSRNIRHGLAERRAKGYKLGAPRGKKRPDVSARRKDDFTSFRKKVLPIIRKIESTDGLLSLSQLAARLEKLNVKTFYGKERWSKSAISSVIKKGEKDE